MRTILLILAVLLTACPAASDGVDGDCVPPVIESAPDIEAPMGEPYVVVRLRVDSDEWSPHVLWVEVVDVDSGGVVTASDGDVEANASGVVEFLLGVPTGEPEREYSVTVTDPRGCSADDFFLVTGLL